MISVRWMPWVGPLRKLIVTKLPYKGQKFLAAALEEEKKITEIRMWPETSQEILDNIYLAQVDRVQSFMNCAFVMIDKETSCYMELLEAGLAYQPNQKQTLKKHVTAGGASHQGSRSKEKSEGDGTLFPAQCPYGVSKRKRRDRHFP